MIELEFRYETGISRSPFVAAWLTGGWTPDGHLSPAPWSRVQMSPIRCQDGTPGFLARVEFDESGVGSVFSWGVWLDRGDGPTDWGIFAETADDSLQYRSFTLAAAGLPQRESYRLSWHRCRGAQRWAAAEDQADAIRFSAWAPNAQSAEVVFGGASGYVADDGYGQDQTLGTLPMSPTADDPEVWEAVAPDFEQFIGRRYLFRLVREDGSVNWATDMFSRQQSGDGDQDPGGAHYDGSPAQLDGRPSCSEVIDPARVGAYPSPVPPSGPGQAEADFWADEHPPDRPIPTRVADLVIYELHVGALHPQTDAAGTFIDAIDLLPYLEALGVNAIELMPMFQFDGTLSWGYGSSHFLAIESAAGGRDGLKHFVKACHQRGIAVIMDVVYNHYTPQAARAAWQYDSPVPQNNIYYWYEGQAQDYAQPEYGYLDNDSSGWAPRYHDEHVRALFVSSAACLLDEFHIDGLRVDQTAAMHAYNALHRDGTPVPAANEWGRKLLRELCQTIKTVWPESLLIAEDHSHWPPVTEPAATGGVGFDTTWYVDFFHHLVGEQSGGPEWAKLLLSAAADQTGPLHMSWFAGALSASGEAKVVYEESHDEAGNDAGTERTILAAVGGAPLIGATRTFAEARCRFACGMSMLAAGTPMFLMGEEVGAQKAYTYDKFQENKEDLEALRRTTGARLFRFYQDVIALRLSSATLRATNIELLHAEDDTRVIAFRRWDADRELIVVGSLANQAFDDPSYGITHPAIADGTWAERLNSDDEEYGGDGVGNPAPLAAAGGTLDIVLPANGVVVLERTSGPDDN